MQHVFVVCDSSFRIRDISEGVARLFGEDKEELLGSVFQDIAFAPPHKQIFSRAAAQLKQLRTVFLTLPLKGHEGIEREYFWKLSKSSPQAERISIFGVPLTGHLDIPRFVYLLLEALQPAPVLLIDRDGVILDLNKSALAIYGDCVGRRCQEFVSSHERRRAPLLAQRMLQKKNFFRLSLESLTAGRGTVPVEVLGIPLPFLEQCFLLIIYDHSLEKELKSEVEHLQDRLRTVGWRLFKLEEQERERIALELHDELAQKLTLLRWDIRKLQKGDIRPEKLPDICSHLLETVDSLLEDVKRIVTSLRPPLSSDLPFVELLKERADFIEEAFGLRCTLITKGEIPDLQGVPRNTALRVFQEATINAVRHANATEIRVELWCQEGRLYLRVKDDGVGMGKEELTQALSSPGFKGMFARAKEVGGELYVSSAPGEGTEVTLVLPVAEGER